MSSSPRSRIPALVLATTLALATGGAAVPVIENPADAPLRQTLQLREVWRVGGDDESDVLLGKVGVAASGSAGEVYVLDSQLSEVQVFDRKGEHIDTLGREGEGPGEFRQPVNLYLPGDGTLAVQQAYPGKITYLGLDDGLPRGTWQINLNDPEAGGFAFLSIARQRGGTFAISASSPVFDQEANEIRNTNYLAVVDADGSELARLSEVSSVRSLVSFTIDELAQHDPGGRGLWDVSPAGEIYLTPRYDAYAIDVYAPDVTLQRQITREHEARLRTEEEKEDQRHSMQININGQVPEIHWKLQDRAAAIDRLEILDDGSLWVRNSYGLQRWPEEGVMSYDVFGPDGKLQREVVVPVPEGGEGHRLLLLDDGRFLLVKGMDSLSISISAGEDEDVHVSDEELGDTLLELVCYEVDTGSAMR
jgi:hypothetical protein